MNINSKIEVDSFYFTQKNTLVDKNLDYSYNKLYYKIKTLSNEGLVFNLMGFILGFIINFFYSDILISYSEVRFKTILSILFG